MDRGAWQARVDKVSRVAHMPMPDEQCPCPLVRNTESGATRKAEQDHEPPYEISVQEEVTARLHFVKFENTYIEACLDFIKDHLVNTETKVIQATGGGAYKFKDLIEEKLQLK